MSTDPAGCVLKLGGGDELLLLPQRAVLHRATATLFVADLHLGKAATFRALGVPVPTGTTLRTLERLDALIALTAARSLIVLGDLLHGPQARSIAFFDTLAAWRSRHAALDVRLVRGNHDDRSGDPPPSCGIEAVDPGGRVAGLTLVHEPGAAGADFWLAGHLHPVIRIGGRSDSLRLACFWLQAGGLVLPAFGEFTGGWLVRALPGERLFVTDGEFVRELPTVLRAPARSARSSGATRAPGAPRPPRPVRSG
jgi:DNA ligase-associated metallophosphoesterase